MRAVAAGAGEHDADRPLVLVLGQRAEEEVNRQAMAARRGRFQQLERTVQKGHVPIGRNDVGAVGPDRHPIFNLEDLHAGIALDQVGEDALVVRGQVLHQDKGHAGIGVGGHAGKESLKRRQSPGRCADADDGKARLRVMPKSASAAGSAASGGLTGVPRSPSSSDGALASRWFSPSPGHLDPPSPSRPNQRTPARHRLSAARRHRDWRKVPTGDGERNINCIPASHIK